MLTDRLRELWPQSDVRILDQQSPGLSAFMLCPVPVVQFMAPWQHAQAICLYRLAYLQAQAQVQQPRILRIPAFSAN